MVFKRLRKFSEDADRWVNGALSTDLREAAETIVKELQESGPVWSGEFANSWVIETSGGNKSGGSGAKTVPQPVTGPLLSGAELYLKPEVKYTIYNVARHAGKAIDEEPGIFFRPKDFPEPLQENLNPKLIKYGTRENNIRGDLDLSGAGNTRTAPLDWYDTYLKGKKIDRTIKISMDRAFRRFPR